MKQALDWWDESVGEKFLNGLGEVKGCERKEVACIVHVTSKL